jgi:peptide/nickel transport system ATP-binding protein
VAALQKPTSGVVKILGQDISRLSQRELRPVRGKFGFVFQDPATALNPRLRVGDCVAEPLRVHKVVNGAELTARVAELLDAVRLPKDTAGRYPHELSGGQRQRANLARALALSPDLLVADEPTSALDVSVQASVLDLFDELQREWQFACLFVSHDLAVVERVSDDVAVLRNGVVQEIGPHDAVLGNPQTDYTKRLVAAVPVPDPTEQRRRREATAGLFE